MSARLCRMPDKKRRKELGEAAGKYADFAIITADNPDTEDPNEINREILSYYDQTKPYLLLRIEKTPFVQQYTWQRRVTSFSAPERVTKPIS